MKRLLTSVTSVICLALLSLPAQAHHFSTSFATPECDGPSLKLTFGGYDMDAGAYTVVYEITLQYDDDTTEIIPGDVMGSIDESGNGPGANEVFEEMFVVPVPQLAGRTVTVSGTATLVQAGIPYNTIRIRGYEAYPVGPTIFDVTCESQPASLGDRVWNDLNRDGVQDGNPGDPNFEPGIAGVTVNLTDCNSKVIDTDTTDSLGEYLFENLDAGNYCVVFDKTTVNLGCDEKFSSPGAGIDGTVDSDVINPDTGEAALVALLAGDVNLDVDAGLYCPEPELASLGNYVWEDLNGDGIQDDGEPGVPNVDVYLYTDCGTDTPTLLQGPLMTDSDGSYLFENLPAGDYCVAFDLASAQTELDCTAYFTKQNQDPNGVTDSDANPVTDPDTGLVFGFTSEVTLTAGGQNLDLDAGLVCPAVIGDYVWLDDGDDTQNASDTPFPEVMVDLFRCDGGNALATTETDSNGYYDFVSGTDFNFGDDSNDCYYVRFIAPTDYVFVEADVGNDDVDSDCGADPRRDVNILSGTKDFDSDCGLVLEPKECGLTLDKSCRVEAPPVQDFDKCDGKLQQFTLLAKTDISNIELANPDNGTGVSAPSVAAGGELTVFGPFSNNDVEIIFDGGQSVFHMSCSDEDFNDPSDCGKEAGDGKSNDPAYDNAWLLEGFMDNSDRVLDCNSNSDEGFTDSCTFEKPLAPSCETTGDPDTLTWSFDGGSGSCDDSTFALLQKDFECTGSVDEGLNISIVDDKGVSYSVGPDGEFTMQRDGANEITLSNSGGTQTIVLHTSCSQPIIVGETAGALTLVAMDGLTGGTDVTYRYVVSNSDSGDPLTGVKVTDDPLGDIGGPISLGTGDSETFYSDPVTLFETTTNTGSATGMLADGVMCGPEGAASDKVTVTVTEPTCDVSIMLEKVEDKKIKWKLSNSSSLDATIDTLTLSWDWDGNSLLKKVKFDGNDIVKDEAIESEADLPEDALVGSSEWLKEVKDRTLKAGDSGKTLEFEFTENFPLKNEQPADEFDLTVNFSDGSETGCSVTF